MHDCKTLVPLARKRQLNDTRTQELNRQHKARKVLMASHRRLLKLLDKEIAWTNEQLAKKIAEITEWQRTYEILSSVPGIGDGLAFTLLGELPERGTLSNRQVAITACMRKMITILNTMLRNNLAWQTNWLLQIKGLFLITVACCDF